MTFEAVLRIIKDIADNCNYKDLLHRLARIWSLRSGLEFLNLGGSRWDQCIVALIAEGKEFHYSLDGIVLELAPAGPVLHRGEHLVPEAGIPNSLLVRIACV